MFFVLSKITAFALQPLSWIVALLLWALLTKRERRRKQLLNVGIVLLVIFTNPFLLNRANRWWEAGPIAIGSIVEPYDVAIVLGGFSGAATKPRDRTHFTSSADRLTQALELYRLGKVRKILVSGGAGVVFGEKVPEADGAKRFLTRVGVPEADVWTESTSRNTRENAVNSASILAERMPEARCLLFTDGFHVYRASGCFRKAGVEVDVFPVAIRGGEPGWGLNRLVVPSAGALPGWNRLIREWVGSIVYRVRGYL